MAGKQAFADSVFKGITVRRSAPLAQYLFAIISLLLVGGANSRADNRRGTYGGPRLSNPVC